MVFNIRFSSSLLAFLIVFSMVVSLAPMPTFAEDEVETTGAITGQKFNDLNGNGVKDDVSSLKTHRSVHWFLISMIITGLFGISIWIMRGTF